MTFYVQGLNGHELMPLVKVFKDPVVQKIEAIVAKRAINDREHDINPKPNGQRSHAVQAYQVVKELPQGKTKVLAEQIMSSPVETLNPKSTIENALVLFRTKQVRHLPIISVDSVLVGIISERDVLRYLGGVPENDQQQEKPNRGEQVSRLMTSPVLTASRDTDVRYVARLFVEQRVGALPIVSEGSLKGMITRSDVLTAVMRHFVLELWA